MEHDFIEIRDVVKRWGAKNVLKGVSLYLKRGEIVSLLGPNGAGKTTLSSILATLHPATSGDILFKGHSIYKDVPGFRRSMGYCQQRPNLNDELTMYDNLFFTGRCFGMADSAIKDRICYLSEQLSLEKYFDAYADSLSGGYKQRFMIARSLMHSPELVILDEPTVALDSHIRRQLWECIKKMRQEGITIVLTTHYIDEAEYLSDRVCVFADGLIRLVDTPQSLMSSFKKKTLDDVFLHLMQEAS